MAPLPEQHVTLTHAQPRGQLADELHEARPAHDCGRWQKPRFSTVWKQTQPGSWQLGSDEQVPPGQVGHGASAQQSQTARCAAL
jgi:hypothetical protein